MVDAPSLETLKARLDRALSNLIQLKMSLLTAGRLGWMTSKGPFQPKIFYVSMTLCVNDLVMLFCFMKRHREVFLCCTRVSVKAEGTDIGFSGMRHLRNSYGKSYLHLAAVQFTGLILSYINFSFAMQTAGWLMRCTALMC